jgi:hypothetical protein
LPLTVTYWFTLIYAFAVAKHTWAAVLTVSVAPKFGLANSCVNESTIWTSVTLYFPVPYMWNHTFCVRG